MRILMIAPTPFFADRGCHTQIYEEIKALQKLGHQVILCTYGLGRDVPGVATVRTVNFPWYGKLSAGPSKTKILLLPLLTLTSLKAIASFKPDIIHAHLHEGAIIARICQFFYPQKKFVFDMQGSLTGEVVQHGFVSENSALHWLLTRLEKKIVNWFFTITQSDTMVLELETLGKAKEQIANVKDGVDTEIFRPFPYSDELGDKLGIDKNKPRILYMGLLEKYQGVDFVFEAFREVLGQADAQLIVIGYPNIDRYQKICEELRIADKVKFLGRIDYMQLPHYLSLADISLAPKISQTEGDGKIYNYMAMGMLTIAWDRHVAREILGDTGIFAALKNSHDLATKILWAIQHPQQTKELGVKARQRAVDNLSWEAVGKRIEAVYKRL